MTKKGRNLAVLRLCFSAGFCLFFGCASPLLYPVGKNKYGPNPIAAIVVYGLDILA